MIGALVVAGILFYAVLYSGLSDLGATRPRGKVGVWDALTGNRPEGGMGIAIAGVGKALGSTLTGTCNDRGRFRTVIRPWGTVKLTPQAMAAYLAACERAGHQIVLTGSWRSCASQTRGYEKDPGRFAAPGSSLHPRGLAIDVRTPVSERDRSALAAEGWKQSRADEPWHFSWGVAG